MLPFAPTRFSTCMSVRSPASRPLANEQPHLHFQRVCSQPCLQAFSSLPCFLLQCGNHRQQLPSLRRSCLPDTGCVCRQLHVQNWAQIWIAWEYVKGSIIHYIHESWINIKATCKTHMTLCYFYFVFWYLHSKHKIKKVRKLHQQDPNTHKPTCLARNARMHK